MEKGRVKEVRVSYGETRQTKNEFEFDRIDVGVTRELKPKEDAEEVMGIELDKLIDFVGAYMKGGA
jgi:hypothetical protein